MSKTADEMSKMAKNMRHDTAKMSILNIMQKKNPQNEWKIKS